MTSDELAPIISAMTREAPACNGGTDGGRRTGCGVMHAYACPISDHLAALERAKQTLANHADALVELVRACEALRSETHDDFCLVKINRALRRVHAVGKEGKDA